MITRNGVLIPLKRVLARDKPSPPGDDDPGFTVLADHL